MGATVRADLEGSVHVTNKLGQRVVLVAGQPVPDGFTVGDHLVEGGGSQPAAPSDGGGDRYAEQALLVDGSIGAVLDRVGDDPEKAQAVLAAEHAVAAADDREPRKGVTEPLQRLIDDADGGS